MAARVGSQRLETAKGICPELRFYFGTAGGGERTDLARMVRGLVGFARWLFTLYAAPAHTTGAGQIPGNCSWCGPTGIDGSNRLENASPAGRFPWLFAYGKFCPRGHGYSGADRRSGLRPGGLASGDLLA